MIQDKLNFIIQAITKDSNDKNLANLNLQDKSLNDKV